jgi:hypothetical protein
MLKPLGAVVAAPAISAAITFATGPTSPVSAGPLAKAATDSMRACAARAWPYLHCIGTQFGSRHVRLATTDRLPD